MLKIVFNFFYFINKREIIISDFKEVINVTLLELSVPLSQGHQEEYLELTKLSFCHYKGEKKCIPRGTKDVLKQIVLCHSRLTCYL